MSLLDNQINIRDQRKQKENVYIYISKCAFLLDWILSKNRSSKWTSP